ncbi:hypothetical protein V6N13_054031 [Hibiscus sabdariffa]
MANRTQRPVTVFVHNSPPKMHWKGLWATFAHHGDVVDSFIPQKKSRSGNRFGFIRFVTRTGADRALNILNGFLLFGFRVSVAYARFNDKTKYWRKVCPSKEKSVFGKSGKEEVCRIKDDGKKSQTEKNKCKCTEDSRISMQIGESSKVNNRGMIQDRLSNWGFGEISVKKMGGRYFLLSFDDEELYKLLEDLNLSYLKEVFLEVLLWSESFRIPERFTWLELYGIPLHCWNQVTFKRIAGLWGNLVQISSSTWKGCQFSSQLP